MGGRGSVSSIGGEPVSKMGAKIFYNAAKKSDALRGSGTVKKDSKLERAAQSGQLDFINKIDGVKEATRVDHYYTDRVNELKRQIVKLGSADALYKNQKLAREYKNMLTAKKRLRTRCMNIPNHLKKEIQMRIMIQTEPPPLMIELERDGQRISLHGGTEAERNN